MPKISFSGQSIECEMGANLRRVLLDAKLPFYNGIAKTIHCRGLGTCGTCSVAIEGPVSDPTKVEKWRLGFPPHRSDSGLRLACQCKVLGDLKNHKARWNVGQQNANSLRQTIANCFCPTLLRLASTSSLRRMGWPCRASIG